MSAHRSRPVPGSVPGSVPASVVGLVLALLVSLATLLPPVTAPARAAFEDLDAPTMPAGCFGPGARGVKPSPCPLKPYDAGRPTILLWGDSHAFQLIPALRRATRGRRVNLVSFVAGSCAPALVRRPAPGESFGGVCQLSNFRALTTVQTLLAGRRDVKVVLASNWAGFRIAYRRLFLEDITGIDTGYTDYTRRMVRLSHEGTPRLFDRLGRMGVDVDVVDQAGVVPERRLPCEAGDDPYRCDLPRWRAIPEERATDAFLRAQRRKLTGATRLVDPSPGYCDVLVCHGEVDGVATFFDDLHLSATRSRLLAPYFASSVADLTR